MPSSRGPQRKSKAKVPKPPRGSGLNPSGEPAINQLCIPTEQPQMSYFAFDAHETIPQHGHYSGTQSTGFDDQSTSQHGHSYSSTQSVGEGTTIQMSLQAQPEMNPYIGFDDQSTWDFFQNQPSLEAPPQGSYPEHYSQDLFQGPTGSAASMSMLDTTLIQQGEIPQTDVMHTAGPARLAKRRGGQRLMPPTPRMAPYPTTRPQTTESLTSQIAMSSTHADPTPTTIIVPDPTIGQTMKGVMKLVTRKLFTLNVMTIDKAPKKAMLTKVIHDSLPQCFGPNTTIQNFITSKHQSKVANTLSVTCGKVVEFARMGAFHAYQLFPPLHSTTPPVIYRKRVIDKITLEGNRLMFMHIYTFNQDGRIEIKAKFQHPFIMSNVIRFVWFGLRQQFLGETEEEQLERLKYIWALSGGGAAVVWFGLVQRQFDKNREPDQGPVLPFSTNLGPNLCKQFAAVRFGFF
ncbi:uncharacterized protein F5891DRAFT_1201295 [Suillus fuscotomentosus]|uniref:Uncharacterized protein n=1 Tax=Suillus fuscotomentosus TaxID=1912939 RepID=A0AAD4HBW9_9AGAM|nr:uncharacterized protein F5891DRAFT_1201295 [Suillus fuscotomentosus]KAG1885928.1 hypothetical protein F5891DRAFT_1201295 [Suillus fuscotomentosus]